MKFTTTSPSRSFSLSLASLAHRHAKNVAENVKHDNDEPTTTTDNDQKSTSSQSDEGREDKLTTALALEELENLYHVGLFDRDASDVCEHNSNNKDDDDEEEEKEECHEDKEGTSKPNNNDDTTTTTNDDTPTRRKSWFWRNSKSSNPNKDENSNDDEATNNIAATIQDLQAQLHAAQSKIEAFEAYFCSLNHRDVIVPTHTQTHAIFQKGTRERGSVPPTLTSSFTITGNKMRTAKQQASDNLKTHQL